MNGLELTEKALDLWNDIHPGESLYLQCQRMSWYFQWAYQGDENIVTYGTALKAAKASKMFTTKVNDPSIKAGDELFWDVGTDGDVATCVGRSSTGRVLVAATAKSGDTVKSLSNHVVIRHADTQPWPFLGASRANGKNKPKSGIVDWPVAELEGHQRRVALDIPANGRLDATKASAVVNSIAGLDFGNFDGWKRGESIDGNNVWFRGAYSGNFWWSGSFTDTGTHDLADLNEATIPAGEVGVPVVELPPARDPDMVQPTAADFPSWIKFDVKRNVHDNRSAINAEARAYYSGKGQDDDYYPVKQIAHWWGSPDAGYTHDGVVGTLTGKADYSVHFVVSGGRITEVQPLELVAYTTGSASMQSWSTENDPLLTDLGYRTLGFLTYLMEKLNPRLKGQAIGRHNEALNVSTGKTFQTSCSDIDTSLVREYADMFALGVLDPTTGVAPVVDSTGPNPTTPTAPTVPAEPTTPSTSLSIKGLIASAIAILGALLAALLDNGWS